MTEMSSSNVVLPRRLDIGQGHRIASHVITYHQRSDSTTSGSEASSSSSSSSSSKEGSISSAVTAIAPLSPAVSPLTLSGGGLRSPLDMNSTPNHPPLRKRLSSGGTTALGRRVPLTRISADITMVGENAATFTCASAVAMSKGMTGGSVGFSSLPDQVHRKAVRRGFDFTLMVVGDSGLGKSTLITSMFQNEELYENKEIDDTSSKISKTVEIDIKKLEIEEDGIRLRLTIVDTPGFNDAINSTESWKSIENYIDAQFDHFFQDESGISRKNIVDNRVHCCLYFISPYGHGLRPIDVKFMRQLHNKVNIVPVIAKADILTKPELERIKLRVLKEINEHQLNIYSFPEEDETDDDQQLRSSIPFAVIGADTIIEVAGKRIRGRRYPWGIVDVDNPDHCDFAKLRQMLISTHLQDLKDATRDLYENYRAKYIQEHVMTQSINGASGGGVSGGGKPLKYSESIIAAKDTEIQRMQEQIELMKAKLKQGEAIAV